MSEKYFPLMRLAILHMYANKSQVIALVKIITRTKETYTVEIVSGVAYPKLDTKLEQHQTVNQKQLIIFPKDDQTLTTYTRLSNQLRLIESCQTEIDSHWTEFGGVP